MQATDDFVHLHVHSEFSLLDGLGRVDKLVERAKAMGQPALALTDHGTMHGVIPFFRACQGAGIRPVIGVEAYMTRWGRPMEGRDSVDDRARHHVLLLAQNQTGYRNLLKICSDAQMRGYYYKPRIDADYLAAHAEGLICTTGCLAAEVPSLLNPENGAQPQERLALERLHWYLDVFGKNRFYIEMQEHDIPALQVVNKTLLDWSKRHEVGLVATNDVHYVEARDAAFHDVLLCVQTSSLVSAQERMRMPGGSYYLKSGQQMRDIFRPLIDLPDSAFTNTLRIAEMCDVDLEDQSYHLPDTDIPEGYSYESYLRHITEEGLRWRYGSRADDEDVVTRREHELKIIHQMGFDVYFLIVGDLCRYARSRGIWYNVRGSGAGSIVAYAVGITGIDPLVNNLVFERFLNPGRVTMPDFDLDFPDDQREEMIRYTIDTYGADRVAQIVSFGRMKARAAVRDVGRALDVPLEEVDRIAKLIPAIPGKPVTIEQALGKDPKKSDMVVPDIVAEYEGSGTVRELLDNAMALEGVARHSSTHAAAVIVTDKPLVEYLPVMRPQKAVITDSVTQFEFPICESIGLLKVDFLGLSTLTVMREATRIIRERHGIEYTLDNIPLDDPESYKLLSSGEVSGVFQVEGAGLRRMLVDMQPSEFNHIVAAISLYRPGPMDFIPDYIAVMHGRQKAEYVHPVLEPILGETYGICVSGDALITDAATGRRHRLDEINGLEELLVQGVDADWQPAIGRVTDWIDSGFKPVYQLKLRSGASVKVTADHRLLTETGWQPLSALSPGDFVATPQALFGPDQRHAPVVDRRRLRVLAYLIADGSLTSGTMVDFVSKDRAMLAEYERCLDAFADIEMSYVEQVRDVVRIGVAKAAAADLHYHAPNSVLAWLRELGLKYPPGETKGGAGSREKFIPETVFELAPADIAFFLASLWDGDGYMGRQLCHYKTVARQLALDVQTLLLRTGIASTIHEATYDGFAHGEPAHFTSYQVTVYDTVQFASLVQPHMVSCKREVQCTGVAAPTIARERFVTELDSRWQGSYRQLMSEHAIDRQHFYSHKRQRQRIPARVVAPVAQALGLADTQRRLNVRWDVVVAIEPAGVEHVFDLTVAGLHSFVANNIIVHNCVYQEQVIRLLTDIAGYTAAEADNVRRGISKKSEKVLIQHREIFAEGSKARVGLTRKEADTIWDALMGFARYGFNRAHAADYAVITVQTAYLKAHYPLEYMAAMLQVERNNSEKVAYYITESRRMGIDVLAPDIDASGMDFGVEAQGADAVPPVGKDSRISYTFPVPPGAAIRYGLAAIKNVGEGPVQAILDARSEGGPFKTLDGFCERVDLRKVGKKALECLIKVGALDRFGQRAQLLEAIEQMIGISRTHHEAAEVGQLTMFDIFGGAGEGARTSLRLPDVPPLKPREQLDFEKELLGVFVSSHPLQQMTVDLTGIVTCSCGELDQSYVDKYVMLAGNITRINQITTKKGDRMAFVTLEDLQGQCDLVVFPKLWEESSEHWKQDKIVLVRGKVNKRGEQVSVICDEVQDYVMRAFASGDDAPQVTLQARPVFGDSNGHGYVRPSAPPPVAVDPEEDDGYDSAADDEVFIEEPDWMRSMPPVSGTVTRVEPVAQPEPVVVEENREPEHVTEDDVSAVEVGDANPVGLARSAPLGVQAKIGDHPGGTGQSEVGIETEKNSGRGETLFGRGSLAENGPGYGVAQAVREPEPVAARGPVEVVVTVYRSDNAERDKKLMSWVYNLLRAQPGPDRFCVVLKKNGGSLRLDFPNDSTLFSDELEQQLIRQLGVGNVEVQAAGE